MRILDALEQLESFAETDRSDWPEDEAFHLSIMEATHNAVIVTFGQLVRLNFREQDATKPVPAQRRRVVNKEHRSVYEAIDHRDAEAARKLMFAHVTGQRPCCSYH